MTNFSSMRRDLRKSGYGLCKEETSNPFTGKPGKWTINQPLENPDQLGYAQPGIFGGYVLTVVGEVEKPFLGKPIVRVYKDAAAPSVSDVASQYATVENLDRGAYCIEVEPPGRLRMALARAKYNMTKSIEPQV